MNIVIILLYWKNKIESNLIIMTYLTLKNNLKQLFIITIKVIYI